MMKDEQLQILIDMSKEMAVNTSATLKIEEHLKELNSKTFKNQNRIEESFAEVNKINRLLLIIGIIVGMLFVNNASDFIKFVTAII